MARRNKVRNINFKTDCILEAMEVKWIVDNVLLNEKTIELMNEDDFEVKDNYGVLYTFRCYSKMLLVLTSIRQPR